MDLLRTVGFRPAMAQLGMASIGFRPLAAAARRPPPSLALAFARSRPLSTSSIRRASEVRPHPVDEDEAAIWTQHDWNAWKRKVHFDWHDWVRTQKDFAYSPFERFHEGFHERFERTFPHKAGKTIWKPSAGKGRVWGGDGNALDLKGGQVFGMLRKAEEADLDKTARFKRWESRVARSTADDMFSSASPLDRWLRRALEKRMGAKLEDVLASQHVAPDPSTVGKVGKGLVRLSLRDRLFVRLLECRFDIVKRRHQAKAEKAARFKAAEHRAWRDVPPPADVLTPETSRMHAELEVGGLRFRNQFHTGRRFRHYHSRSSEHGHSTSDNAHSSNSSSRNHHGRFKSREHFRYHFHRTAHARYRFQRRYIYGPQGCPRQAVCQTSFFISLARKLADSACRSSHEQKRRAVSSRTAATATADGEKVVRKWAMGSVDRPTPAMGILGGEMGEDRRWSTDGVSVAGSVARWIVADAEHRHRVTAGLPPDRVADEEAHDRGREHDSRRGGPEPDSLSFDPGSPAPPPGQSSTTDATVQQLAPTLLAALRSASPVPPTPPDRPVLTTGTEGGCVFTGSPPHQCPVWIVGGKRHRTCGEVSHRVDAPAPSFFQPFDPVPPIPPALQANLVGAVLSLLPSRPPVSTAALRELTRVSMSLVGPVTALLRSIPLPSSKSSWLPYAFGLALAVLPLVVAAVNGVSGREETPFTGRARRVALTEAEVDKLMGGLLPSEGSPAWERKEHWVRVLGEMTGSTPAPSPVVSAASSDAGSTTGGSAEGRMTLMGCDVVEDDDARVWWAEGVLDMVLESQGLKDRYDVVVLDREEQNAFGFGFAPDAYDQGSRGVIVVYSGVLDAIMNSASAAPTPTPSLSSGESGSSYRSTLPSTAQTHSLSLLLSHELAHLLLSHPLESLSLHRTASLMRDVAEDAVTALVWPLASAMGPWGAEWGRKAVESVARGRRTGTKGDAVKGGWWIRTAEMESEADDVALRIMADAGFDPRLAVAHWCGGDESRFGHV